MSSENDEKGLEPAASPSEDSTGEPENGFSQYEILDATCGGRSIWLDGNKDRDDTLYIDIREEDDPDFLQRGAQLERNRQYTVEADEIQDFRDLPYEDGSFRLIVWDPPHIERSNGMQSLNGIMVRKYGALHAETWQSDLKQGFEELWRVLKPGGTLCFKFADEAAEFSDVLDLFPRDPLFGTTTNMNRTETRWFVFYKPERVPLARADHLRREFDRERLAEVGE